MPRIHAVYTNFESSNYPALASKLKKHLTPKCEEPSVPSQVDLPKVIGVIPDTIEPFKFITIKNMPWDHAGFYAYDIGLFDMEVKADRTKRIEEAGKLTIDRYKVVIKLGCPRAYTIEIYGKNLNNCGDHPLELRIDHETCGHADKLFLLKSWLQVLKDDPKEFINKIIDVGLLTHGTSPEHDVILSSLPKKKEEEFIERIETEKRRLNHINVEWAINMARFYNDFWAIPINEIAGEPFSIEFLGEGGFNLSLLQEDLRTITTYPTLPMEEVVRRIFPKPHDDLQLVK